MSDPLVRHAGSAASLPRSADLSAARAAVEGALPGPPSHEDNRARILDFLDAHPDALVRSCTEGHLTGSAAVVDPASRRLLLLFHTKVRRWLQPGGHADGEGNLAAVALREAEEETGIAGLVVVTPAVDLDVHLFQNAAGTEPDHLHLDVRHLVVAPTGAVPVGNHESQGLAWVALDELARYDVDPGTLRLAVAALEALGRLEAAEAAEPGEPLS
ncbi:MAG: NUDIX hydrolase [Acidimicrobiales bacterium]|nr:NUDIX hydrolase [Acidimicrobiales bacterium]